MDEIKIPKTAWFVKIIADQTVAFDGSTVVLADLESTILQALSQDPEWQGVNGLSVTAKLAGQQ